MIFNCVISGELLPFVSEFVNNRIVPRKQKKNKSEYQQHDASGIKLLCSSSVICLQTANSSFR